MVQRWWRWYTHTVIMIIIVVTGLFTSTVVAQFTVTTFTTASSTGVLYTAPNPLPFGQIGVSMWGGGGAAAIYVGTTGFGGAGAYVISNITGQAGQLFLQLVS